MKITVSATLLLYAAMQTVTGLSSSSTSNLLTAADTSKNPASTSSDSSRVLPLSFGANVLSNIQLLIPLMPLLPTKSTESQKPSPFLPPITKSLVSLTICDAHGRELLPNNCIPSPTLSENSNSASQSSEQREVPKSELATETSEESSDTTLENAISTAADRKGIWLHVMPTTGGDLAARQVALNKREEAPNNDDSDTDSSEYSSSRGSEQDIGESSIFTSVDNWLSIEENESELAGLDDWESSEAGSFSDKGWHKSSSISENLSDISWENPDDEFGNLFSGLLDPTVSSAHMSAVTNRVDSTTKMASASSTHTSAVKSFDVVSFAESSSSILGHPSTESTSQTFDSSSLLSTHSESTLSSSNMFVDSIAWTAKSESRSSSRALPESPAQTIPETTQSAVIQSRKSSTSAFGDRSLETTSSENTQTKATSNSEESSARTVPGAGCDNSQNIAKDYNENMGCTHGTFRCTSDKRSFDTCVFGRWGTIRTCSQGTSCIPLSDNSIACG